jgi:protease-4
MGKLGVEEQTVKSGDKKDIMSPFRKATPEEVRLAQDIVDQFYNRFLDVVMSRPGNKLTRDELKKLADGRLYSAKQALDARLIDRISYLDDVIAAMRNRTGHDDARIVSYYRPGSYRGSIYSGMTAKEELLDILGSAGGTTGTGFMYLWRP